MTGINLKIPSAQLQTDLRRTSVAALFVLLWEWFITLDDEVDFIWSKSNRSWVKWLFLFSRYFIIAMQICTRSLEAAVTFQYEMNDSLLRVWYCGQVMTAALVVSSLEVVLMARVYALYRQKLWIGIFLLSLLLVEVIAAILGLTLTLPGSSFDPDTVVVRLPTSFAYLGIASVVVQCIVLLFTLARYRQSSLKTVPLVSLMMRDGTFVFIMLTIFVTAIVTYTLCNFIFAVTGYAWLLSAVSCSTCRMIINMERMSLPSESHDRDYTSTNIQFTTIFTDRIAFEDINEPPNRSIQTHSDSQFETSPDHRQTPSAEIVQVEPEHYTIVD